MLRHLKTAFQTARITACDLKRDGVDFCASQFDAIPVYARESPAENKLEPGRCPSGSARCDASGRLRQVKRDLLDPVCGFRRSLSYGGLELLRTAPAADPMSRPLQAVCAALGGDYGGARRALLLLALPYLRARRREHLQLL